MKTQKEIEREFVDLSPYWAYRQGIDDGVQQCWDAFRANAAKDAMCALIASGKPVVVRATGYVCDYESWSPSDFADKAVEYADALIKKLREQ